MNTNCHVVTEAVASSVEDRTDRATLGMPLTWKLFLPSGNLHICDGGATCLATLSLHWHLKFADRVRHLANLPAGLYVPEEDCRTLKYIQGPA